jgi:hypothetical protein
MAPLWSRFAALALLTLALSASPVWAWGRVGHRVTGRIAEQHLTPQAKAAAAAVLAEGESLADVSTWADEQRRTLKGTGPWHYVDVPLDEPRYDAKFSGPGRGGQGDRRGLGDRELAGGPGRIPAARDR